jgi:hypothetical protein
MQLLKERKNRLKAELGPGTYQLTSQFGKVGRPSFDRSARTIKLMEGVEFPTDRCEKEDGPGPGSYSLHSEFGTYVSEKHLLKSKFCE